MNTYYNKAGKLFILLLLVSGCSVSPVRPYVEDFVSSVSTATSATERRFGQMRLDDQIQDLRRTTLAGQGALYTLEGCTPMEPTTEDFSTDPLDFEENCEISAQSFDPATQQIRPARVTLPEGDPRVQARNARNLVRGLNSYALALDDLLKANSRSETAAAAASALKALGKLADTASEGSSSSKLFTREGQNLVSQFTDEVLETYRYRLMKDVTSDAAVPVEQASRTVAAWLSRTSDNASVESAYLALEDAVDAARPGSAADLKRIEDAYETAREAENGAAWRVYWEIGAAHAAIVDSFSAPSNFDLLKEANDRILSLREVVKEFNNAR